MIAAYVGFEAVRSQRTPEGGVGGIGLAAGPARGMPPLAIAKGRIMKLGSSATKSEGQQNMLYCHLSTALLVGLGAQRPVRAVVGRPNDLALVA